MFLSLCSSLSRLKLTEGEFICASALSVWEADLTHTASMSLGSCLLMSMVRWMAHEMRLRSGPDWDARP